MALRHKGRPNHFKQYLCEIEDIGKMLEKEGKTDGERRYFEIMALLLLFIDESLRSIRSFLACGIGLALGLIIKHWISC